MYDFFHLPLSAPFLWYEELRYSAPYCSTVHSHPAWQLTVSLEGTFFFDYQGREVWIAPGEWVLFSPELPHCAGSRCECSAAAQIFFRRFPGEMMPELSRALNFRRNFVLKGKCRQDKISETVTAFRKLRKQETPLFHTLKNLLPLNFLVDSMSETALDTVLPKELPGKFLAALEYMEQHYAEPVGVPDFAAEAGLSVSRFNELFRNVTGLSPMRYFNEIRLSHAQMALLAGESVEEAAQKSGFASASYFCRCFKNYTGRTPGEFKEKR